jgi:8-hydroxy-5-deazaflavin:NADPH oxidoreductase
VAPPGEPVCVIGASGPLGSALAARLAGAGVKVVVGSRDEARGRETALRIATAAGDGADVTGFANEDAVVHAEVVFLTVPFSGQAATLKGLAETLREGQLLVDATVPLAPAVGGRPTRVVGVWQGSAAQQAAELVPGGVRVVSALHTVSAATLGDLDRDLDEDVLVCGDRREDKQRVADLIHLIPGLRCVDAGKLESARIAESLTALLIGINGRYRTHAGMRVTNLPDELWAPA